MDGLPVLEELMRKTTDMRNKAKTPKVPGFMRTILATNVRGLMDHQYKESTNKPKALAGDAGVSLSTVQRMLDSSVGSTIDNIELLAAALGVSAYQLLLAELSPENPQIVVGAAKGEERMYARWRRDRVTAKA